MKYRIGMVVCVIVLATLPIGGSMMKAFAAQPPYEVAAYYFPSYHADPRNEQRYGKGWTEWELMKQARPRFNGHIQPKIPAWGYVDESDPVVMERKIDAAADAGLTAFIFDWYWHSAGPYLERCLNEGFLKAKNRERLKFALMWANHDWVNIFPAKKDVKPELLYPGAVSREVFDAATDHVIRDYFSQPNYWRIDGKPYFSVYELMTLISGLGSLDKTREALDSFRERARTAGIGEIHLNAVVWGVQILPNEKTIKNPEELLSRLGFDSVTSYCWIHHVFPPEFPSAPYAEWAAKSQALWPEFVKKWPVPYYPNVSMGWDSSPRTTQTDPFEKTVYPYAPVVYGTPQEFEDALHKAKDFLDTQPRDRRILTINAWNEWTEGSYLEPDAINGMKYIEAIGRVFGSHRAK